MRHGVQPRRGLKTTRHDLIAGDIDDWLVWICPASPRIVIEAPEGAQGRRQKAAPAVPFVQAIVSREGAHGKD